MPQDAQKGPSDAPEDIPATEGQESTSEPEEGTEDSKDSTFSREYVEGLRAESRQNRIRASRADFLATHVRTLATREACRGVVSDPEALPWDDAWVSEDKIDHDAIRAAAEALAIAKPWLSRPRGTIGQGEHSDAPAALSLSELLRA